MFDTEKFAKIILEQIESKVELEYKIKNSTEEEALELKKEAETNSLFVWILFTFMREFETRIPARPNVDIEIKGKMTKYNKVLLNYKNYNQYLAKYIEGEEFFEVVKDTLQIIEKVGYFTNYFQESDECKFTVRH